MLLIEISPTSADEALRVVLPRTVAASAVAAEQIAALEIPAERTGRTVAAWDAELRERGAELVLINNAHLVGKYHAAKAEEQERDIKEGIAQ